MRYHRANERRLVWAFYLPWSLLMLANVGYLWLAPSPAALGLLLLNGSVAALSVLLAVPEHRSIDGIGALQAADYRRLMRANALRLAAATASLAGAMMLVLGSPRA